MVSLEQHDVLTIVIPALNEEEAIASTISRCLDAREEICCASGLEDVEVVVVSDGSTDRTAEIARGFAGIRVIEFEHNRGYGAAIKEGFRQGRGSLLGFLDADGTCDPRYFAEMCRVIRQDHAEIVLGSRLGPNSRMPGVRRLGNRLYAYTLGILTGRSVTDTASGMRVLTRNALDRLSPMPDGLHFTPAMSARALVTGVRIVEIPMAYAERLGTSKLRVLRDGLRFLRTIVDAVLYYRPDRLFLLSFLLSLLLVSILGAYPLEYYVRHGRVEDWMIYRFLASFFFGSTGFLSLCAVALCHCLASVGPSRRRTDSFVAMAATNSFRGVPLLLLLMLAATASLTLLWPGIIEYVTLGRCTLHWSRMVVGTFFLLAAFQMVVTSVLIYVVELWQGASSCGITTTKRFSSADGMRKI